MFAHRPFSVVPFSTLDPSGAIFVVAISEAGAGSEAVSALAVFTATAAESGQALDSTFVNPSTFFAALAENGLATDTSTALQVFIVSLSEATSGVETVSAAIDFQNAITEAGAAVSETVSARVTFEVLLAELGIVRDTVDTRYLWEIINASQPAVWQNVGSAQGVTWSVLATDTGTAWVLIKTAP